MALRGNCAEKAPDLYGGWFLLTFGLAVIVIVVVMVAIAVVMIPITLFVPLVSAAIPPPVILIPAVVALGIQIAAALRGLAAALAVLANGIITAGFRFLDPVLAFRAIVICVYAWHDTQRQYRSHGGYRGCRFS